MIKKFNFDYDYENDDLFIFDPHSKSKASVEMDDFIVDYNDKKEISAIELLNASKFFKEIGERMYIDKNVLKEIIDCQIDIIRKNNFLIIKFMLSFKSNKSITTPLIFPSINESVVAVV